MSEQKNTEEFLNLKNGKVHQSELTEVFAQLGKITEQIYIGLQRESYYEDKDNWSLMHILILIEAWITFLTEAEPRLDKAMKEEKAKKRGPSYTQIGDDTQF